jgi:hypothetical protein
VHMCTCAHSGDRYGMRAYWSTAVLEYSCTATATRRSNMVSVPTSTSSYSEYVAETSLGKKSQPSNYMVYSCISLKSSRVTQKRYLLELF